MSMTSAFCSTLSYPQPGTIVSQVLGGTEVSEEDTIGNAAINFLMGVSTLKSMLADITMIPDVTVWCHTGYHLRGQTLMLSER